MAALNSWNIQDGILDNNNNVIHKTKCMLNMISAISYEGL